MLSEKEKDIIYRYLHQLYINELQEEKKYKKGFSQRKEFIADAMNLFWNRRYFVKV
jgi:hypothetical protein